MQGYINLERFKSWLNLTSINGYVINRELVGMSRDEWGMYQNMTIEDAAVYLRDQVDLAGNEISSNVSTENILKFKKAVSDFLKFIEQNNFDVEIMNRKLRIPQASKQNFFSPFELPPNKMNAAG